VGVGARAAAAGAAARGGRCGSSGAEAESAAVAAARWRRRGECSGESWRRTEAGEVEAAGAASGWSPEEEAAAALRPVERARVRERGGGAGAGGPPAQLGRPTSRQFFYFSFFIFLIRCL